MLTYEAYTFLSGPVSTTFAIGTITFDVTANVASDGPDVFSGFFNVGADGVVDNSSNPVAVGYGHPDGRP